MSCCHGSVRQVVRPGSARVKVTELSGSGQINPTPATKPCEISDAAVAFYLSPENLKLLCGTQDLSLVTSVEICVDTQENTLSNFGAYLPRLEQLKLNNSMIKSVRDLGTTLSHLQVLWMCCCSLRDLDGISTLSSLKELYAAYNYVSDLSQIGMLENLQLLDLEGNDVDDLVQIQYLGLCGKLQMLSLQGNPVCVRPNPTAQTAEYSYRAAVRELVPQLGYLDDVRVEEDGLMSSSTLGEDWAILRNSIRDFNSSQSATEEEDAADSRPGSSRRPASSLSFSRPLSSVGLRPRTGSRPMSATTPGVLSPPGSRPGSAGSHLVDAETSSLTHGAGKILFCGNIAQAVRAKRDKLRTAPTRSAFAPHVLPIHVPEHTYDLEEPDDRDRLDVFAELRAWREQHSSRLQAIETDRLPQVLSIHHSDEEEDEDYDEEGVCGVRNDSSDEEHCDSRDTGSPDSSFQSLSPDLHRETLSPEVARLSLSPHTTLSPPSATLTAGNHKLPAIHARRLRLTRTNPELLPNFSSARLSPGTGTTTGDMDLTLQRLSGTHVPVLPQSAHMPRPPPKSARSTAIIDSSAQMDSSSISSGKKHLQTAQMSKLLDRPVITRPHTARAALQRHHQQRVQQPCRKSSHPD